MIIKYDRYIPTHPYIVDHPQDRLEPRQVSQRWGGQFSSLEQFHDTPTQHYLYT